ncbi:MAG: phenylacetate--CoA ligase family protein [Planctomycetes bacterium]|nr:phenylacetate--CoA ligase family protein [Planctomycetota bacterium]
MNARLVRHVIYPLHELLRGRRTFACLRELEATQWWSPEKLQSLQRAKLRELLIGAQAHCPYYRRLFATRGVDPAGADPFDALSRLPTLNKALIRAHRDDLTWTGVPGGIQTSVTGGSTGQPLRFHFDRRRQGYDKAARMRTHRWFGADVGDREAYLWGNPLEITNQDRLKALRDRLTNELLLSAFDLTEPRMADYLDRIGRYDPRSIFGYPSSLTRLCRYARSTDRVVQPPSLRAVFVTGELLDDAQRRLIHETFAVPVANGYGSREAGFIAHDCPEGRMHVTDENVIVEFVDDDGRPRPAGRCGEIVITHLDTPGMPLIRYRTGDVGRRVEGPCPCGRGLSGLEIVGGRRTDHLVATDGTVMHGLSLIYVLREIDAVEQFQVRQDVAGAVEIAIVPAGALDRGDLQRIERGTRDLLGWDVALNIRQVDRIETSASGKFRCVVSQAAGDCNPIASEVGG